MRNCLLRHAQHGPHDQSHAALPGLPLSGLMLRHSDMTFGILKSPLYPQALRLNTRRF
jgi:hypothetical protein